MHVHSAAKGGAVLAKEQWELVTYKPGNQLAGHASMLLAGMRDQKRLRSRVHDHCG